MSSNLKSEIVILKCKYLSSRIRIFKSSAARLKLTIEVIISPTQLILNSAGMFNFK